MELNYDFSASENSAQGKADDSSELSSFSGYEIGLEAENRNDSLGAGGDEPTGATTPREVSFESAQEPTERQKMLEMDSEQSTFSGSWVLANGSVGDSIARNSAADGSFSQHESSTNDPTASFSAAELRNDNRWADATGNDDKDFSHNYQRTENNHAMTSFSEKDNYSLHSNAWDETPQDSVNYDRKPRGGDEEFARNDEMQSNQPMSSFPENNSGNHHAWDYAPGNGGGVSKLSGDGEGLAQQHYTSNGDHSSIILGRKSEKDTAFGDPGNFASDLPPSTEDSNRAFQGVEMKQNRPTAFSSDKEIENKNVSGKRQAEDSLAFAPPVQPGREPVINLLHDSDGSVGDNEEKTDNMEQTQLTKKQRTSTSHQNGNGITKNTPDAHQSTDVVSSHFANNIEQLYRPGNLMQHGPAALGQPSGLGASMYEQSRSTLMPGQITSSNQAPVRPQIPSMPNRGNFDEPMYIKMYSSPTWRNMLPDPSQGRKPLPSMGVRTNQFRHFRLSLLNVNEFTIAGLPTTIDGPPTPLTNLRTSIRQISRDHGKAVFERDKEGLGGKWRIPLGAYQSFITFLTGAQNTRVDPIPQHQLQIASLERARQEKGYPTPDEVCQMGVPLGLAKALAPFQRGGVDFVNEKNGRALIADDMGLGKTIQGIASMSMYSHEWPLLVLCPSSARYHWASEFRKWLGRQSPINQNSRDDESAALGDAEDQGRNRTNEIQPNLLDPDQVHVLTSSKEPLFPQPGTRVVVCSYGLAPTLVSTNKITPGVFGCAIVDESHMLKNKSAKRTMRLIPILQSTKRCVLLSGTPALARPAELWPQLEIIGTTQHGWWEDEQEFTMRYVKNATPQHRAELHTLLIGTVMIRRLKVDILKTLPHKVREKASVKLLGERDREEFKELLLELKQSKGALGTIARKNGDASYSSDEDDVNTDIPIAKAKESAAATSQSLVAKEQSQNAEKAAAEQQALHEEMDRELRDRQAQIQGYINNVTHQLNPYQLNEVRFDLESKLRAEMESTYKNRLATIMNKYSRTTDTADKQNDQDDSNSRKTLLSRLYSLTGNVKVPLVVDLLKRWFNDPTKGKVCIFAHHLSVLDAIALGAELSNDPSSSAKFIRIDGSTSPKSRQQQIDAYQTDPSIRVALLGITAAGVAVTLTASSTVWFAELFWTPALMIQAEDRAHRIGQASQVRCLYIVARGTLDDVLWKLIEKKFQDLGEFVEGKEKLKMVVHKEYKNKKELFSTFQTEIDPDDEEPDDAFMEDNMEWMADQLEDDILSLVEEEKEMVKDTEAEADDDDAPPGEGGDEKKPMATSTPNTVTTKQEGKSEEAAITLSSGEESGDDEPTTAAAPHSGPPEAKPAAPVDTPLSLCRMYRMLFPGPAIGVDVDMFQGRIFVNSINPERLNRLGPNSKPSVGDVFVSINRTICPLEWTTSQFRHFVKTSFLTGPVQIVFAEIPEEIRQRFLKVREQKLAAQKPPNQLPPSNLSEIIVLDSDEE